MYAGAATLVVFIPVDFSGTAMAKRLILLEEMCVCKQNPLYCLMKKEQAVSQLGNDVPAAQECAHTLMQAQTHKHRRARTHAHTLRLTHTHARTHISLMKSGEMLEKVDKIVPKHGQKGGENNRNGKLRH